MTIMTDPVFILATATPAVSGHGESAAETTGVLHTGAHPPEATGFPPFDSQYWVPQLVWLALIFGVFYLLMARVALPRTARILDSRARKLMDDMAQARTASAAADVSAKEQEARLAQARAAARDKARATQLRLAAETEAQRKVLEDSLATKMATSEVRIADLRTRAMAHVSDIGVQTAAAMVARINGASVDVNRVSAAVAAVSKGA
jgi:F-type H+-transporting ATPase subunit b